MESERDLLNIQLQPMVDQGTALIIPEHVQRIAILSFVEIPIKIQKVRTVRNAEYQDSHLMVLSQGYNIICLCAIYGFQWHWHHRHDSCFANRHRQSYGWRYTEGTVEIIIRIATLNSRIAMFSPYTETFCNVNFTNKFEIVREPNSVFRIQVFTIRRKEPSILTLKETILKKIAKAALTENPPINCTLPETLNIEAFFLNRWQRFLLYSNFLLHRLELFHDADFCSALFGALGHVYPLSYTIRNAPICLTNLLATIYPDTATSGCPLYRQANKDVRDALSQLYEWHISPEPEAKRRDVASQLNAQFHTRF